MLLISEENIIWKLEPNLLPHFGRAGIRQNFKDFFSVTSPGAIAECLENHLELLIERKFSNYNIYAKGF